MFKSIPLLFQALCLSVVICSCSNPATSQQEISKDNPIAIKADEIKNVVSKEFISLGRPVIRPIIVEVEKGKKAIQKGYTIYLSLKNRAKLTTYQNIKYEIIYLDKTGVQTDKEIVAIKKIIKPGESLSTQNELKRYKLTAYKVSLISASSLK